jgi:hypothetical protein
LRDLERRVAAGDREALQPLYRERSRRDLCSRCGVSKPYPAFDASGRGYFSWARDEDDHKVCWACAAVEDLDLMEGVVYDDRWFGYAREAPAGQGVVVSGFTGMPLVWGSGYSGRAGFGGSSYHWQGEDRYGREWHGWNSGPAMHTRMRLYKGSGQQPGRQVERRTPVSRPFQYSGWGMPAYNLRRAQDRWLAEHGAEHLPASFNPRSHDVRLRELERRWKETGSVEDEAAWLRARARAGELDPARLEVAAKLAYPAARLIHPLPPNVVDPYPGSSGLLRGVEGLLVDKVFDEYCMRCVIAVARSVAPLLDDFDWLPEEGPRSMLRAAQEWLVVWSGPPIPSRRGDLQSLCDFLTTRLDHMRDSVYAEEPSGYSVSIDLACSVFSQLTGLAVVLSIPTLAPHASRTAIRRVGRAWDQARQAWSVALMDRDPEFADAPVYNADREANERIVGQVREEVIPWLLELEVQSNPRNPDADLRELKRRADVGGEEDVVRYHVQLIRVGELGYDDAVALGVERRGPICGWELSWEHPGVLVMYPPSEGPPWGFTVLTTPWFHVVETGDPDRSPFTVFTEEGHHWPLEDLYTPRSGDLVTDIDMYREAVADRLSYLAAAAAARHGRICACAGIVEPRCPDHGYPYDPP